MARPDDPRLGAALDALKAQNRPPDATVVILTGPGDVPAPDGVPGAAAVVRVAEPVDLGGAVRTGLAHGLAPSAGADAAPGLVVSPTARGRAPRSRRAGEQAPAGPDGWLWLLDPRGIPAPEALAALLARAETSPTVGVVGAKHVTAGDPPALLDAGVTETRTGTRFTGVEPGELDQGQHDARDDVLAVDASGMLVRADVWERLGGFDPALRDVDADLDLCRRAWLAGHRVLVAPGAVVTVAETRMAGLAAARRARLHRRLAEVPTPWLVPALLAAALAALGRALGLLAVRDPRRAGVELVAAGAVLTRPAALARSRSWLRGRRGRASRSLRGLQARPAEVRRARRARRESLGGDRGGASRRPEVLEVSAVPEPRRGPVVVALVAGLGAIGALALSGLWGRGPSTGGALLPVLSAPGQLWRDAVATWTRLGLGSAHPADPFALVPAGLTALAGGSGALATASFLAASLPLAGLGAWCAAGTATAARTTRLWAALSWAAAPVPLLAVADGRLGALIVHAGLPWLVLAAVRTLGAARRPPGRPPRPGTGRRSWRAAGTGSVLLAVLSTGAPVLVPLALVALASLAVAVPGREEVQPGRPARRRATPLLWWPVPMLVLHVPFALDAFGTAGPRAWFADPGVPLAHVPAPAWQHLLGLPEAGRPWLPAAVTELLPGPLGRPALAVAVVAVGLPVLAVALAALARAAVDGRTRWALPVARRRAVLWGWWTAVAGWAGSLAVERVAVADTGARYVSGWPGAALSVATAGLLVAAVAGLGRPAPQPAPAGPARRSVPATAVVAVLAALGLLWPVAGLAAWGWGTAAGHDRRIVALGGAALPTLAAESATGPAGTRTLVVAPAADGALALDLERGRGTELQHRSVLAAAARIAGAPGRERLRPADGADLALERAGAGLAGGAGADVRAELARLAVGYVLAPAGAESLTAALDGSPALTRVTVTDAGVLWRVRNAAGARTAPAWARLTGPAGEILGPVPSLAPPGGRRIATTIAPGPVGRRIVLSERADAGWRASLGGRALRGTSDGWAQAFVLPATGGRLVVAHADPARRTWLAADAAALAVALLLALPAGRARTPGRAS